VCERQSTGGGSADNELLHLTVAAAVLGWPAGRQWRHLVVHAAAAAAVDAAAHDNV